MMNATGYDVATIGNHEFDYGYAQLAENMKAAKFKSSVRRCARCRRQDHL